MHIDLVTIVVDDYDRAIEFFVSVSDAAGHELERHPSFRPVSVRVPDAWFAGRNWSA